MRELTFQILLTNTFCQIKAEASQSGMPAVGNGHMHHGEVRLFYFKSTWFLPIDFRALCGANFVTSLPKFGGHQTRILHRVDRPVIFVAVRAENVSAPMVIAEVWSILVAALNISRRIQLKEGSLKAGGGSWLSKLEDVSGRNLSARVERARRLSTCSRSQPQTLNHKP